mmetsp:Transcript_76138/g.215318  ORF Transcript_76138/g.215318 Transcript_76138/m.215318 type:complete len:372 (-) Transcript_76138:166-1281(-)
MRPRRAAARTAAPTSSHRRREICIRRLMPVTVVRPVRVSPPRANPRTCSPRAPKKDAMYSSRLVWESRVCNVKLSIALPCQNCSQTANVRSARWSSGCRCPWTLRACARRGISPMAASSTASTGQHTQYESHALWRAMRAASGGGPCAPPPSSTAAPPKKSEVRLGGRLGAGGWRSAATLMMAGTVLTAWLTHHGSHSGGMLLEANQTSGPPAANVAWKSTCFMVCLCRLNMRSASTMAYSDSSAQTKANLCCRLMLLHRILTHWSRSVRNGRKKSDHAFTRARSSCAERSVAFMAVEPRCRTICRALCPFSLKTCQASHPSHARVPVRHTRGCQTTTKRRHQSTTAMQTTHAARSGTSSSGTEARQSAST